MRLTGRFRSLGEMDRNRPTDKPSSPLTNPCMKRSLLNYYLLTTISACLLASCARPAPDLTSIKSVGVSNGFGNTLYRNKVGTTIFNNDQEEADVPEISDNISKTAVKNLKTRFAVVQNLTVPTNQPFAQLFVRPTIINEALFRKDSIAAARAKNLDAVWILYPSMFSEPYGRGPGMRGSEHRVEYMLGIKKETVSCISQAELVDTRSGKVISPLISYFAVNPLKSNKDWMPRLEHYDPVSKKLIIDSVTNAGKIAVVQELNLAKITSSPIQ
jgi:hypothetical protein